MRVREEAAAGHVVAFARSGQDIRSRFRALSREIVTPKVVPVSEPHFCIGRQCLSTRPTPGNTSLPAPNRFHVRCTRGRWRRLEAHRCAEARVWGGAAAIGGSGARGANSQKPPKRAGRWGAWPEVPGRQAALRDPAVALPQLQSPQQRGAAVHNAPDAAADVRVLEDVCRRSRMRVPRPRAGAVRCHPLSLRRGGPKGWKGRLRGKRPGLAPQPVVTAHALARHGQPPREHARLPVLLCNLLVEVEGQRQEHPPDSLWVGRARALGVPVRLKHVPAAHDHGRVTPARVALKGEVLQATAAGVQPARGDQALGRQRRANGTVVDAAAVVERPQGLCDAETWLDSSAMRGERRIDRAPDGGCGSTHGGNVCLPRARHPNHCSTRLSQCFTPVIPSLGCPFHKGKSTSQSCTIGRSGGEGV